MPRPRLLLAAALTAAAAFAALPAPAPAATTWLCRPGIEDDPCQVGLATTRYKPDGDRVGVQRPRADRPRRVDCFYVYPTVSDEPTVQASLAKRPEISSIARFQAARYSQHCRVYAPVYRQMTLAGIYAQPAELLPAAAGAYSDVRAAWREYLRRYNKGRGVVLIGHSQGSAHATRLLREEIEPSRRLRRHLVSAILLGGDVTVRRGSDRGGDFEHVRACRRPGQVGCVIAFSTYGETPPPTSAFGRAGGRISALSGTPARSDLRVLCTNPAALRGGSARVTPVFPSVPFAPGTTIAAGIGLLGYELPRPSATPWVSVPGSFSARCVSRGGADVLLVRPRGGAPALSPSPDANWGLHLVDANIALGDLVRVVGRQVAAYTSR